MEDLSDTRDFCLKHISFNQAPPFSHFDFVRVLFGFVCLSAFSFGITVRKSELGEWQKAGKKKQSTHALYDMETMFYEN